MNVQDTVAHLRQVKKDPDRPAEFLRLMNQYLKYLFVHGFFHQHINKEGNYATNEDR